MPSKHFRLSGALRQASADTRLGAEYAANLLPLSYGNEAQEFAEPSESFDAMAATLLATHSECRR
ncbi:MAG: hypothetical protein A3F78_03600 [Burkholderiales bacterium RIFCSPLOWO2_12_FULL_61_40]|nr:MAG: hypothetical protein A3F78_03600 [Burkholderiales bacterium RIFCSPLOWO2_12_FULL_61_40]